MDIVGYCFTLLDNFKSLETEKILIEMDGILFLTFHKLPTCFLGFLLLFTLLLLAQNGVVTTKYKQK